MSKIQIRHALKRARYTTIQKREHGITQSRAKNIQRGKIFQATVKYQLKSNDKSNHLQLKSESKSNTERETERETDKQADREV